MLAFTKIGAAALLTSIAFALSACATRPMLEDVVPYTTTNITDKVRCDARHAILVQLLNYMTNYQGDARSRGLQLIQPEAFTKVRNEPLEIEISDLNQLPKEPREKLKRFLNAAVIYDFEFEIQEQNNIGSSVGYNDPVGLSRVFGTVSANSDRTRRNKRSFRVEDSFLGLIKDPPDKCEEATLAAPLPVARREVGYPITDDLNLAETVGSFWYLTNYSNLTSLADGTLTSFNDDDDKYSRLVDEITFTTKLSGTLNPQFADVGEIDTFRLTPVSLTATNLREDIHKLVFALAMPKIGTTGGTPEGASRAAQSAADRVIDLEEGISAVRRFRNLRQ